MSAYSLDGHGRMVGDPVRMAAYGDALRATVRPGSVVVDIGTGTGVFALLAARLGARRVYGIEPDDVVQVAREAARENGLADRVEFIQAVSTRVTLPERADVVVMDVHGALPLFRGSVATVMDARDRLLKPGGALIPRRETLWAALAEAPAGHARLAGPWGSSPFGLRMEGALRRALNAWGKARVPEGGLVTEPAAWAVLDYATLASPHARGEIERPLLR
ncbi:MAG TPA: 50S ribosomal protein L11 methyltransferase, partial [Longimicrobiaceae bacterium]|nr:50S ribosomal protein L11 methyltransferase [Longimicrobiaceae bacterium]